MCGVMDACCGKVSGRKRQRQMGSKAHGLKVWRPLEPNRFRVRKYEFEQSDGLEKIKGRRVIDDGACERWKRCRALYGGLIGWR